MQDATKRMTAMVESEGRGGSVQQVEGRGDLDVTAQRKKFCACCDSEVEAFCQWLPDCGKWGSCVAVVGRCLSLNHQDQEQEHDLLKITMNREHQLLTPHENNRCFAWHNTSDYLL